MTEEEILTLGIDDEQETVQIIEAEGIELLDVEADDAFAALGEPNEDLKHQLLNSRDLFDQHPITAITGLREELDYIESLKTAYSNEKQAADYYEWADGNILQENRFGYFVSLCEDIRRIKLCEGDDIFGVTVDSAAFVGGQDYIARDYQYGLVAHDGVVLVRCETDVDVGDYVVSNIYGMAAKSSANYGCKVIALHDIKSVRYAIISLDSFIDQMHSVGDELIDINANLADVNQNIVVAINEANKANQGVQKLKSDMENFQVNIEDITKESKDAADAATKTMNDYKQQIEDAQRVSVEAQAIATSAATSADKIRKEAVATANNALAKVNDTQREIDGLVGLLDPLSSWTDGSQSGIVGFVARANADSATLATLAEWKEDDGDNQSIAGTIAKVNEHEAILNHITSHQGVNGSTIAQVEQKADDNGASITNLVASVDQYSVGEYSQAYGLTREQATKILKPGCIYIPTENDYNCCSAHKNTESHCETMWNDDGTEKEINEFTPGNYYVWTVTAISGYTSIPSWDIVNPDLGTVYYVEDEGLYYYSPGEFEFVGTADPLEAGLEVRTDWMEYNNRVWFLSAPPANSYNTYKYWYLNSDTPEAGYEAYALYIWDVDDASWKKVNTLAGNASNRMTSMLRQTTNEIAAEVADARGSVAALDIRVGDNESEIQTLTEWRTDPDGNEYNLATIKQTADDAGASIAQVVEGVGKNGKVTAASIVTAVNNSGSSVTLSGDHIILNGATTNGNGTFAISTDGHMTATGGTISGWKIGSKLIYKSQYDEEVKKSYSAAMRSGADYAFAVYEKSGNDTSAPSLTDGWDCNFYVGYAGKLYAKNAEITGKITATSGSFTGEITATGGSIGGWTIGATSLKYGGGVGSSGSLHLCPGGTSSKASIGGSSSISGWGITVGSGFGVTTGGKLYATGASISGEITATSGNFANSVTIGGTSITAGSLRKLYKAASGDTGSDTYQIKRIEATGGKIGAWSIDGEALFSTSTEGGLKEVSLDVGMVSVGSGTNIVRASWYNIANTCKASDQRLKHNIDDIAVEYDNLFDALMPKTFNYTTDAEKGDPNSIHFGFVAQDILATQDRFGCNRLSFVHEDMQYYSLKMDEFIALNTWQIQKAKARIADLENRIGQLEKLLGEKGEK